MQKGKKTEALNENIQAVKQTGAASRLAGRVEVAVGYINAIDGNMFKLGEELKFIRDEADFGGTFEQFIKETFGRTRGWAYQFIQGFEARASLPESVQHDVQNPRQALALAGTPPEKREAVLANIKDSGKEVTAKEITKETAKQKAVDAVVSELDDLGTVIPNDVLPEWNRAKDEAKVARDSINGVARWFRTGLGEGEGVKRDPIFRAVTLSNKKLFDDVKRQIAMVEPYAVCPTCKGSTKVDSRKCGHCKGTGFISKFEYGHAEQPKGKGKK